MTITPEDLLGATDLVNAVKEAADKDFGFEEAVALRAELIRMSAAVKEAMSAIETEILRQVERQPRTIGSQTFMGDYVRSRTTNHDLILDRAWKRAMLDAVNDESGAMDWDLAGEIMRDLVVGLYLSPSTEAKKGGLDWLGLQRKDVETTTTKGRKLRVIGEED